MNRLYILLTGLVACAVILAVISCTKSPLGENTISGDTDTISGKVMLDTNTVAKNALIWLDGLNVSTYADENGNFTLKIPPVLSQGGSGGYTGTLSMYFYVGNYAMSKQAVALQSGRFIYNSGPIDKKGKLKSNIILRKLLDIDIELLPQLLVFGADPQIKITVTLTAVQDTVSVYFPGVVDGTIGPIIIANQETGEHRAVQTTLIGVISGPDTKTLQAGESQRRIYLLGAGFFENKTARYELIPYLLLRHQVIPNRFYLNPGGGALTSLENYWQLPFDRTNSILNTQKSDD